MVQNILSHNAKRLVKVNGRTIGWLEGNTFYKSVVGSRHKLRQPPAWAVDAEVFDYEVKPNATEIVIIDKETGKEYHTSTNTFDQFKGVMDRGFGRQYYLPLNHWKVKDGNSSQKQLSLWGDSNG